MTSKHEAHKEKFYLEFQGLKKKLIVLLYQEMNYR